MATTPESVTPRENIRVPHDVDGSHGIFVTTSDEAAGARPHAIDPGEAARLWALSAKLTGIDVFATRR
ncbi:hypothetical protein [Burkholderia aenigmatica]|uniref:Uncharacterized protein n=1 Tax=Burkholderia aenigmatica TaxID=2015348 RepID=A0A228J3V8_9BURK|nr:hypothetical protein [Burkholderia aenigmatica]OXI49085.1 hypothetical protein CFB84_09425 [Burkholderia aenigmatica]